MGHAIARSRKPSERAPARCWRRVTRASLTLVCGLALAVLGTVVPVAVAQAPQPGDRAYVDQECAAAAARSGVHVEQCVKQARIATVATRRYRDVWAAVADGFVQASACEHTSAGVMGEHWIRLDRMAAQTLDAHAPEILLYLPTAGGRRLVGAEFEESALVDGLPYYGLGAPDPRRTSRAPVMLGRRFDGPMAGHNPVQPWHYDLHVWLWAHNPSGLLAQYNPSIRCGQIQAQDGPRLAFAGGWVEQCNALAPPVQAAR